MRTEIGAIDRAPRNLHHRLHIIIHTQYYPPEIGAPQARLSELATGLAQRGHMVTVLTAMPNYPQGKVYPGYGGWMRSEQQGGIRIVRTLIFPSQTARLLPRLLSYFSFVFSSTLLGGWRVGRADYLITESPPLFLGIAGYLLSRWKRARWIFNVSDLWPESAVRLGMIHKGLPLRLSQALEAFCYRKAWLVTGQSRTILENIAERFPRTPTYHLSNGVDTRLFLPSSQDANTELQSSGHSIRILYAGLHGHAQGLGLVLDTALRLHDHKELRFVLVGDGPEKASLQEKAHSLALDNVQFHDPVPRQKMPEVIAAADICLIPLKTYLPGAVPSKLYEAMACAKPVILIAEGEAAEIVARHRSGIIVNPGDTGGLTEAVCFLACNPAARHEMGTNGRRAVENNYDRSMIVEGFATFLEGKNPDGLVSDRSTTSKAN